MADKGTEANPICPTDLPWTAPADGVYYFHHRGWADTHPVRPLRPAPIRAGTTVTALSPSGTPLTD